MIHLSDSDDDFQKKRYQRIRKSSEGQRKKRKLKEKKRSVHFHSTDTANGHHDMHTIATTSTANPTAKGTAKSASTSFHNKKKKRSKSKSKSKSSTIAMNQREGMESQLYNKPTHTNSHRHARRHTRTIPRIKSPLDICWHQRFVSGSGTARVLPCHITKKSRSFDNNDSDSSSEDFEDEVTIEYLSAHQSNITNSSSSKTVMPKRLIPFHGKRSNNYDHDDICRIGWCDLTMETYLDQQRRKISGFDPDIERRYLMDVLNDAKRNGGYEDVVIVSASTNGKSGNHITKSKPKSKSKEDAIDLSDSSDEHSHSHRNSHSNLDSCSIASDELEEPYTQAVFGDSHDDGGESSDEDEDDIRGLKTKSKKASEPIRPGDVIEYYNPIFVKGR